MNQPTSAHVRELTPTGRGAIAVLEVAGPGAIRVADAAFRPLKGQSLARTAPGRLRVGRMGAGLGDEVVAAIIPGTQPRVEVQCHGGPQAVELVRSALIAAGATLWSEGEGPRTLEEEAEEALPFAPTLKGAEVLLEQAQGALRRDLLHWLGGETDPNLDELLARAEFGIRLIAGWKVALAGRPNVGKSALLNALAGYERAIVAPEPGTTRDAVTVRGAFGGWPVELADTAGLRTTDNPIEREGVAIARGRQRAADLVLLVWDRSEPLTDADHALRREYPEALVVASKADLPAAWQAEGDFELVSALTGAGIESLCARIADRLVPTPPPPGVGVPFLPRHREILARARELLRAGDADAAKREIIRGFGLADER